MGKICNKIPLTKDCKTCILNVKVSLPFEPPPSKAAPKEKVKVLPTEVMFTVIGQSDSNLRLYEITYMFFIW